MPPGTMRLALFGLLLLGCGQAAPCSTSCLAIEGGYLASWQAVLGGSTCPASGPRPTALNFSRQVSVVRVPIGGVQLSGTLYDTNDFSLRGTDGSVDYALRGVVTPSRGDAPQRVTATLVIRSATCEAQERLTADKT